MPITTRMLPSLTITALILVGATTIATRAHAESIPENEEGTFG